MMIWYDLKWYDMKWHDRQWYRGIYRHRVFQMCTCKHHFCTFHFFEVSVFPSSTMVSSWAEFAGDGVELVRIPDESSAHRPGMDHPGPSWMDPLYIPMSRTAVEHLCPCRDVCLLWLQGAHVKKDTVAFSVRPQADDSPHASGTDTVRFCLL